jgi:hypothetical protein
MRFTRDMDRPVNDRCSGCGRRDVPIRVFRCTWPDHRVSIERHCDRCRITWQRQLQSLGAVIEEVDGDSAP